MATCPECSAPAGDLTLQEVWTAQPIGTHSLAGMQPKVNAVWAHRITCGQCGWSVLGQIYNGSYLVLLRGWNHGPSPD